MFRARARAIAGPWHALEVHRLGTQTFVPLAGARCVLLLALDDGDWVVIERRAATVDCDVALLSEPVGLVLA